MSARLLTAIYY